MVYYRYISIRGWPSTVSSSWSCSGSFSGHGWRSSGRFGAEIGVEFLRGSSKLSRVELAGDEGAWWGSLAKRHDHVHMGMHMGTLNAEKGERSSLFRVLARTPFNSSVRASVLPFLPPCPAASAPQLPAPARATGAVRRPCPPATS